MGPIYDDIDSVQAADPETVQITFKEPAPFLLEALEAPDSKERPSDDRHGTVPCPRKRKRAARQ